MFDPVSPVVHAAKIQAPALQMHGIEDERVPVSHGKKMRNAQEMHKKEVTWKTFEREGHRLHYVSSQLDYYATLLAFLDKHLGPVPPARVTDADKPARQPSGDQ